MLKWHNFGYIELNKFFDILFLKVKCIIEINFTCFLSYFLNLSIRKLKITYVACFILYSTLLVYLFYTYNHMYIYYMQYIMSTYKYKYICVIIYMHSDICFGVI